MHVVEGLEAADLEAGDVLVDALVAQGRDHAQRLDLQARQREVVAGAGVPTVDLPQLVDGVDLGGLYELAAALREQGVAR